MNIFQFLGKGVFHEDHGMECQDRLLIRRVSERKHIFAISDGCSSSAYAKEAAQRNVDTIETIFTQLNINELSAGSLATVFPKLGQKLLSLDDIGECFRVIFRSQMVKLARQMHIQNPKLEDFCATLVFLVQEEEKTLIGHIGDGVLICYNAQGVATYISNPENGQDSSHTYFTLSDDFSSRFHYEVIPTDTYESCVLFSDGPQKMFYYEGGGVVEQGVRDEIIIPMIMGKIQTNQDFQNKLQELISHAMHYIFDDWSIIVAQKGQGAEIDEKPLSLKSIFNKQNECDESSLEKVNLPAQAEKNHENSNAQQDAHTKDAFTVPVNIVKANRKQKHKRKYSSPKFFF